LENGATLRVYNHPDGSTFTCQVSTSTVCFHALSNENMPKIFGIIRTDGDDTEEVVADNIGLTRNQAIKRAIELVLIEAGYLNPNDTHTITIGQMH
jgi:hypothetical protein